MPAIAGKGTLLRLGDGASPEVFTTVARVRDIGGLNLKADMLDVSDMSSAYKQFIAGLKEGGEIKVEINYDPADATHKNASGGLLAIFEAGVPRDWKLVFPTSSPTTWSFSALVSGFEVSAPHDGKLSASVTLQVTGTPTLV